MAWRRGPSKLEPWYGPPRLFSYTAEVQPVLDKHCVACHDYGEPGGEKLNLAGDLGLLFNTSYVELRGKGYVNVVGAGPFQIQPPKSWGSHDSRLVEVLLEGHGDPKIDRQVRLDQESFDRIVGWVDINAPYYSDYSGSAYRDNLYGRSPLNGKQLQRLKELTEVDFAHRSALAQISFTRPELSPCLEGLADQSDGRYKEALAIIQSGQKLLAERPRPDMRDFQLVSPVELAQESKYQASLMQEVEMRMAILRGEKKRQETGEASEPLR
jgi:hypothetical protein